MNQAAVSIPEKIFFKIGEVCDITGIQAHVLRYWESEFPMLAPQKNRAGQRTYRRRDVEMVLRIKELLYDEQYTIAGAKKKLQSDLRGASKLKVVTPEMSAGQNDLQDAISQTPSPPIATPPPAPSQSIAATTIAAETLRTSETNTVVPAATMNSTPTNAQRIAMQRLKDQLHELLVLLEPRSPRS